MLSSLISMIQSFRWERVNEKKADHMNRIRRTVQLLHSQVSNQFPKPKELNWLLVQYIELEFEVLYYYNPPEVSAKLEYNVGQQVLTALQSMFIEKCDTMRRSPDSAGILRLLSGVKKEYFTVNGFISSITKRLLRELGTRSEDFECVHLGTYLKDRFSLLDKNFTTSDYGTDSDSDLDTDGHIRREDDCPTEVPLTIGNTCGVPTVEIIGDDTYMSYLQKGKIAPELEPEPKQTSEKVLETVVICSDSEEEAPKVTKRKREAPRAVATLEIMDDDDDELNYMVYMAKCEPKPKKKPKFIPNEEIIICSDSEEEDPVIKTATLSNSPQNIENKKEIVKFEPHEVNSSSIDAPKQIEYNNNETTEKTVKLEPEADIGCSKKAIVEETVKLEPILVNNIVPDNQFESSTSEITEEIVKFDHSEASFSNINESELPIETLVCDKLEIIEEEVKVEAYDPLLDMDVSEDIKDYIFKINSETQENNDLGHSDLNQEQSNKENSEELVPVCSDSRSEPPTLEISKLDDEIHAQLSVSKLATSELQYDLPQFQCDKVGLDVEEKVFEMNTGSSGGFLKSSYFPTDEMFPQIMADDMDTDSPLLYNLFESIPESVYTDSNFDFYPCTSSKETLENFFALAQGDDVSGFNLVDPHSVFPLSGLPSHTPPNARISDGVKPEDSDAQRPTDLNDSLLEEFLSDSCLNESKSNVAALDFFLFNSSKDEPEQCKEFVDVAKSKQCQELLDIFKSEQKEEVEVATKRKARKPKRKYSVKRRKKSIVMPLTDFTNSEVFTPLATNASSRKNSSRKLSTKLGS